MGAPGVVATAPSGARGGGPGTTTLSDGPRTALFVVDVQDGVQPDSCLRSTLHGALARGDDALLVSDAHTTEDLTAHGAPPPAQVVVHTDL